MSDSDYTLTEDLGSMSERRVLNRAIVSEMKALARKTYRHDPGKLDEIAEEIVRKATFLGPQVADLYTLACQLQTEQSPHVWLSVPRIAGGEQQWMTNLSKDQRYGNAARAAHRMLDSLGLGLDDCCGVLVWGADDEDRLKSLGAMPMYLEASEFGHHREEGSWHVFKALKQHANRLGFDLQHQPKQFGGGSSVHGVVLRLTYGGRLKTKGGRIKGGYVGG